MSGIINIQICDCPPVDCAPDNDVQNYNMINIYSIDEHILAEMLCACST